jgi:hypothetical protein
VSDAVVDHERPHAAADLDAEAARDFLSLHDGACERVNATARRWRGQASMLSLLRLGKARLLVLIRIAGIFAGRRKLGEGVNRGFCAHLEPDFDVVRAGLLYHHLINTRWRFTSFLRSASFFF